MARPRKKPEDRLRNPIPIRFTEAEYKELKQRAFAAGVTLTHYARETILGRRPKARPASRRTLDRALNELRSIATNFVQLETATGDESFGQWARYVGGELIERIFDKPALLPVIESSLDGLNEAGQVVNQLAHQANAGVPLEQNLTGKAIEAVREATAPIHEAIEQVRDHEKEKPDRGEPER